MVSKVKVEELQKIIQEEYGVVLNDEDAFKMANNFSDYYDLLARLHHKMKSET